MRNIDYQSSFLYLVLFLSGFAGLGYEMVWTRMLAVGLGHEIVAVLAVVGAFFCGMALGAWGLDRVVSRSARPGRWYAMLELVIGLWSLALIFFVPQVNRLAASLIGTDPSLLRHWSIAFLVPFLLLLPATFAMGATLPAIERLFSRLRGDGWSVGGLYAANTFGAVAGTLAATFLIAPAFGFRMTAGLLVMANLFCALSVLTGPARHERSRPPLPEGACSVTGSRRIVGTLFFTGLLGIGYEVLIIRATSQVLENTVYSFASLLSVYLIGTATGAALYQAFAPRRRFDILLTYLLQALALSCLVGVAALPLSEPVFLALRSMIGGGMAGAISGEMGVAVLIFFLPTLVMGATFSHLAQAARRPSGGVGAALGANTLGAAIAPLIFGVFLLPAVGLKPALLAASLGYLLLIPSRQWKQWLPAALPAGLAGVILLNPTGLNFTTLPPGGRLVEHIDGVMAAVSVVADSRGDRYLKVNNKFLMGGTASTFSDWRQGHIPLLLHPNPKSALFLGLGTGATLAASLDHPQLVAHGVELVPEVVEVLPQFAKATGSLDQSEHLKLHVADARRFVTAWNEPFDVIVADLFHPARDGAGFLYTVEHFEAIRSLLNPGGVFCQWLPLYQMDLDVLRTIVRSFMHVFPDGKAVLATYSLKMPIIGLISGAGDSARYTPDYLESRVTSKMLRQRLASLRLDNTYKLLGNIIAEPDDLIGFAGKGPLNTDDRPLVIFQAPEFIYAPDEPAHARLFGLLDQFDPDPARVMKSNVATGGSEAGARLKAYWTARNRFLKTGVSVEPSANIETMLAQVGPALLSIVRESPDFDAAYNPLLAMARRLYAQDSVAARRLLIELEAANPSRHEARKLREYLGN